MGMRTNFFNKLSHVNWARVGLVSFAWATAWAVFADLIPALLHKWIFAVTMGVSIFLGILTRGTRYQEERRNPEVRP